MKKSLLALSTLIVIMASCENKEAKNKTSLQSGINQNYLDTTVSPAEDFYQYACGGWMKAFPLTAEYARYGSFDKLGDDNQLKIKEVIEELAKSKNKAGSVAQKIGDLYNLGMNDSALNRQAASPILPYYQEIVDCNSFSELQHVIAKLHSVGIQPFFTVFGEANPENSDMTIAWLWQSGMGMGDKDYYLKPENEQLRAAYQKMIAQMFTLSSYAKMIGKEGKEAELATAVLNLETRLAAASMDRLAMREPELTFNYRSMADLKKMVPNFDFDAYFKTIGLNIDSINIGQVDYIKTLFKVFQTTEMEDIKTYLAWNLVNEAAPYLSDRFIDTHFAYYGKTLSGKEENKPRWKRVLETVNSSLGEAVGQMYVDRYFPKEAKDRMIHLVDNLKIALAERIETNTWMTATTKEKAIEKLNAFHVKIGYPDKWRDYSALEIKPDSYFDNVLRVSAFENAYQLAKINKPVDKDEWLMSPQTVNAYYNPSTNEICFPAAILQPPFFDMNADDAVNYGAIGVVIGHEMTHGFDDKGSKYDKNGNLNNWWTDEDRTVFEQRTQVLVDHFNKIEVLPGLFADGAFTLGENIADNGGLQVSFLAMTKAIEKGEIADKMDNFTPQQRFFLAYANIWASNIRNEEIRKRTKEDPHSLGKWRVNGTLPHVSAFIDAFNIQPQDKMYLAPASRAEIW